MPHARPAPLLSILIPTKDRYETLVPVVTEIARRIADPRLEIVVCDNSRAFRPEALDPLLAADPRLVRYVVAEDVSIVENTERGLAHCRGAYICFIGDDDLVSPEIMRVVEWLDRQGEDCLIFPPARYWWSSVRFARESRAQRPGVFWLPQARDGAVRRMRSRTELDTVLAGGGVAYMNLPRLYHGVVSRGALARIRERFGRDVPGSSPDMALCVALALTTDEYLSIDYPVTVFGAARNSGGGRTAARRHFGKIEEQAHLPADILDHWDPHLPRIWSEQIIYPQTIHEVMSRAGRRETGLSYPTLYASLLAYEPFIFTHLWPVLAREVARRPTMILPLAFKTALKLAGRARVAVRGSTGLGMGFDIDVLPDVAAVMDRLERLPLPASLSEAPARPAATGSPAAHRSLA